MQAEKMVGNSMKKTIISLSILSLIFSCVKDPDMGVHVQDQNNQREYQSVTMVIPPIVFDDEEPMTKINLDLGSLKYLWAEKDSVGIFPDLGSQIYFSMAEGVGQSVATFDGGGWALKRGSSYYSYFPFVADYYIDKEAIPVNFNGQVQDGNGNLTSAALGNHCFMVAKGVADEATGNLMFSYERLQMPFMFVIPVEAGTYTSLDVCAGDNVIAVSGTMNAISLDKEIHDAVFDDHLSVDLKNVTFTSAETLIVTAMLPPFNIYGKQFIFNLKKADGTVVTSSVFGKNYALGKAYRNAPNFSVAPTEVAIPGDENTFEIRITAAGSKAYSVTTDVDWLSIENTSTSGSATIQVNAAKGIAKERVGYVIVSEDVTYNGTTITLQNKVKITQDINGMAVGVGDWEDGDNIIGSI